MKVNSLNLALSRSNIHGATFEVPRNYSVNEAVGQGAYGVVCSAVYLGQGGEENRPVAIKKIENAFEHLTYAKRTLRELRILRHLHHENLIDASYVYLPGSVDSFNDLIVGQAE